MSVLIVLAARSSDPTDLTLTVVCVAGVILFIVVGCVASSVLERRRREAMRRFAETQGLSFDAAAAGAAQQAFAVLPLFQQGHTRKWANETAGTYSRRTIRAFDFRYTVGYGKHRRTRRQTVVAVRIARLYMPQFILRPEHLGDRIKAAFGFNDVDFEGNREFSRKWAVHGGDPGAVRSLFRPELLEEIMRLPRLHIEGIEDWLLVYRAGTPVKPENLVAAIEEAVAIAESFSRWGAKSNAGA